MTKRIKILYTTPILHYPNFSGPHLNIENSLKALSMIADIYLYSRISRDEVGGMKAIKHYEKYTQGLFFSPLNRIYPTNLVNVLTAFIFGKKYFAPHSESERIYKDILKKAQDTKANIIWLGFGNISYPLLKFIKRNSSYRVVLQTDSVWSRFILRGLPYTKDYHRRIRIKKEGKVKEKEERWGSQLADITTAVSEVDAQYYRKFVKNDRIKIFSNVIDLEEYIRVVPQNIKKPAIFLGGSFWKESPMEDAARWFINNIWPIIKKKTPEVYLYIAGKGSDERLKNVKDSNIFIEGRVRSFKSYLKESSVSVVPLRFESGTRFKILEAGAYEIPVVSTTLGAEGLELQDGKNILIADETERFADQIIYLLNHKKNAKEMGIKLKKVVEKKYSVQSLMSQGKDIIKYLIS